MTLYDLLLSKGFTPEEISRVKWNLNGAPLPEIKVYGRHISNECGTGRGLVKLVVQLEGNDYTGNSTSGPILSPSGIEKLTKLTKELISLPCQKCAMLKAQMKMGLPTDNFFKAAQEVKDQINTNKFYGPK